MKRQLLYVGILISLIGCADKRPVDDVLPSLQRMEKSFFSEGEFYYSISVVATSPDAPLTFVGDQADGEALLKFDISEKTLSAHAIDPRYSDSKSLAQPILAAEIEKHFDVEREKNADDELTHKEIENDKDRPWKERQFANVELGKLKILQEEALQLSLYEHAGCVKEEASDLIVLAQEEKALNMTIRKTYKSDTFECRFGGEEAKTFFADIKVSLVKKDKNPAFKPTPYTQQQQKRVGIFKTTIKTYDKYNQPQEKDLAVHHDPQKPIVYILSPNFPDQYKDLVREIIKNWNNTLSEVAGKSLLEIQDNTGQEIGDIRYNFIVWIEDPIQMSLLGYGPSRMDPFTGEIINGNVYLYGGNFGYGLNRIHQTLELKSKIAIGKVSPIEGIDTPYKFKEILALDQDSSTLSGALKEHREGQHGCFYPSEMSPWYTDSLSDEDIIRQQIRDTLVHEMGHNLGLRHNFKGSVDKKHFLSEKHETSSTMDYLPLEDSENGTPGPYDKAALLFSYTGKFDPLENFLFCTDEDVKRDPFCNHFDHGTTAAEIVTYLTEAYEKDFEFRNKRGKRISFKDSYEERMAYIQHLLRRTFIPLREFLDLYVKSMSSREQMNGAWMSDEERVAMIKDLAEAIEISFKFFTTVIMDQKKPYLNIAHPYLYNDELAVRGTRIDKLLAISALTARFIGIDPWDQQQSNYFDLPGYQVRMLQFFGRLAIDPAVHSLISLVGATDFMNEVPHPREDSGFPSQTAARLFDIQKIALSAENRIRMETEAMAGRISYIIDEESEEIYYARGDSIFFISGTPITFLLDHYNEIQKKYNNLLASYTGAEKISALGFSTAISESNKIIQKLRPPEADLSVLTAEDLSHLHLIIAPSKIVRNKEEVLKVFKDIIEELEGGYREVKETLWVDLMMIKFPTSDPEAVIRDSKSQDNKTLVHNLKILIAELPEVQQTEINDGLKTIRDQVKEGKKKIEALMEEVSGSPDPLSDELKTKLKQFFVDEFEEKLLFTKDEFLKEHESIIEEKLGESFKLRKNLDLLKDRIHLFYTFSQRRNIHVE